MWSPRLGEDIVKSETSISWFSFTSFLLDVYFWTDSLSGRLASLHLTTDDKKVLGQSRAQVKSNFSQQDLGEMTPTQLHFCAMTPTPMGITPIYGTYASESQKYFL